MIELHHHECIRIGETYAIVGTVEGLAASTGGNPQEAADKYRRRRMPLVWTTIAPEIRPDQGGYAARQRQHENAIDVRNSQAVKIEGRYYTATVTSGRTPTIRLVPHDLDEPAALNL
jgi:hypothetical protein